MSKDKGKKGTLNRRDFLKALTAIGGAAVVSSGCSPEPLDKLVSYAIPPEDVIPGIPNYYSTVLPYSPVGASVVVKVREGRAIFIEGNKLDPVSNGGVSSESQASLQGLYDPDRIKQPLFKNNRGDLSPTSWGSALEIFTNRLNEKESKNRYIITDNTTGTLDKLLTNFSDKIGAKRIKFETFSFEHIAAANEFSFGKRLIPTYKIDETDYLLSFGVDFLETWLSPMEYGSRFEKMHSVKVDSKGKFVQVEPKLTLTGAKADDWVPAKPTTNLYLALGIINYIKLNRLNKKPVPNTFTNLSEFTLERTSALTGISTESIQEIAKDFASSKSSLAIAGGIASTGEDQLKTVVAVNILNLITDNLDKYDFDNHYMISNASSYSEILKFREDALSGNVGMLITYNANPVFNLSDSLEIESALDKIAYKVSFSSTLDETSELSDLILPDQHPLEQWGDYQGKKDSRYLMQPAMKALYGNLSIGDSLVSIYNNVEPKNQKIEEDSYLQYLKNSWMAIYSPSSFKSFWNQALKDGGVFNEAPAKVDFSFNTGKKLTVKVDNDLGNKLKLFITPNYRLYDGRGANKTWLQELPDLLTTTVWDSWVEVNSKLAEKLNIIEGDFVDIETDYGKVTLQAYLSKAMRPDTISISMGQGHTAYGRYAKDRGINPVDLLNGESVGDAGNLNWSSGKVSINKTGNWEKLVKVQHSYSQDNRDIAQTIALSEVVHHDDHHDDHHDEHHAERDMYREYDYFIHKWGMNIDLDKCTGCGACVTACYAENNIPVVGKEQVGNGRYMSWLTLERFQTEEDDYLDSVRVDTRIIPQLCQHCENAPCEPVCPVFATYHNPEGINVMVYSRCVGTRYCSNNCSYKVRRFNWFKYEMPEPLNMQLNPDVTVRSRGIMEKCNFCLQRITAAKDVARDEDRKLRDGEVKTACQSVCGCNAIVFGDLNEPSSKISKMVEDKRSYKLLAELNTRPSVSYLKKIEWDRT